MAKKNTQKHTQDAPEAPEKASQPKKKKSVEGNKKTSQKGQQGKGKQTSKKEETPKNKSQKKNANPNKKSSPKLPIRPDEWEVVQDAVTGENLFLFSKKGTPVVKLPFTESTFSGIRVAIDTAFPREEVDATLWRIQKPLATEEDPHPEPVMSLYNGNQLLAVTALPQKELKALIKGLQRHVKRPVPVRDKLVQWWQGHKIARVFLIIVLLPVILLLINALAFGLGLT